MILTEVVVMSVNIILYDNFSVDRVKNRIWNYFGKVDIEDGTKDIFYFNDVHIIFQKRMIIINSMENNWKIQECLDYILENEQVTINYGSRMEYSKAYNKKSPLTINFC